jgi:hypothetical protein
MQKPSIILVLASLGGCAATVTPNYDARFGDAVRQARQQMILNPSAPNQDQVLGLDGKAAREASVLYLESFKTPPPVVNVINIGGTVGGK